jgi:hypothetical protein
VADESKAAADKAKADAKAADDAAKAKVEADKAEADRIKNDPVHVPDSLKATALGVARDEQAKRDADVAFAAARAADVDPAAAVPGKTLTERAWDKAMTEATATVAGEAKKADAKK